MTTSAGKVVLIVDDNRDARASLAILLEFFSFSVATVGDGQEALAYLRDHPPPCLIVLDLRMPEMDGWQFLAARRSNPELSFIPVLVYTGEPEWRVRDLLGDAVFFSKAADPMQLIQRVLALGA